jgi:hypothetical protein
MTAKLGTPMRRALLSLPLFTLAVALGHHAHAKATGIFDQNWRRVQQQMSSAQQRQCAGMSFIQKTTCFENVRQQFVLDGDVPGTDPYVQKHYGSMSPSDLNQQIIRLNQTYGVARHIYPGQAQSPGEISFEQIQYDVNAIRQLIRIKGGLPN